ncbi:uncharacterized protein LODBEIA_P19390 [Lodderomyces beijingensis]|uniref:CN hydrolase domain-containing protein n=1 Tax=Lodderomyces beijingensis TaxID=1775926 RepID=A0ABP0ZKJ1_9ASCO
MKVAVGQLCSSSNITKNLHTVYKLLNHAVEHHSQILFLPEATDYISRNAQHSAQLAQEVESHFLRPLLAHIKHLNAQTYLSLGVHLPSTSTTTTTASARVRNVHILIDPQGAIVAEYQKLHLFDVDVPHGPILKESNSVEPGSRIVPPIPIPSSSGGGGFNLGLSICYDIRFPELSLKLRQLGAHILTFPSAFTTKTGEAHWEILSRARALDTQCFVVNAAQCGTHDVGTNEKGDAVLRVSYGDSIVVDPWGKVLARAKKFDDDGVDVDGDDYYEIIYADLDLDALETVRKNMPLLDHRRSEVFGEL